MSRRVQGFVSWLLTLLSVGAMSTVARAQDQSVRPGVNKDFDSPNVDEFVSRFEKEGREVYDKREALVQACQIAPATVVADVGAGTGLFTRLFAQAVGPAGQVIAVDISDEFVDRIEKSAAANQITNIKTIVCAPDDSRLPPNSVDLVFICDTYHHFEFPLKTMSSIFRALRPDGRVVIVDFKREAGISTDWVMNHVRAGQDVVRGEIESVGFKLRSQDGDLLKDNYVMVFGK